MRFVFKNDDGLYYAGTYEGRYGSTQIETVTDLASAAVFRVVGVVGPNALMFEPKLTADVENDITRSFHPVLVRVTLE